VPHRPQLKDLYRLVALAVFSLSPAMVFGEASPPYTIDVKQVEQTSSPTLSTDQSPAATQELATQAKNESSKQPSEVCEFKPAAKSRWMDRAHRMITRGVCLRAVAFDRFFGDVRNEDDYQSSFMRVRNSFVATKEDDIDLEFRPRVRARIYLPQFTEKFNLIVFDDSSNGQTLSTAEEIIPEEEQQTNRYSAALRWVVETGSDLQLDFDVGARFDDNIQMFLRWRFRRILWSNDNAQLGFTNTTFWRDPVGFGNTSEFRVERTITKSVLLQWQNEFTFSEESMGIDWTSRTTIYNQIDDDRAVSYSAGIEGRSRPEREIISTDSIGSTTSRESEEIKNYGLSMRYRQRFLREWLFWEFEQAINWPLERNRASTPQVTFRIEVQFRE